MATAYRIKDWKKNFEKADHRKCSKMHWLAVPTKHDGKGFVRIGRLKNSVSVFCGWCLILQIAAKMPERGTLIDADGPLSPQDMADKTGFPESVFSDALEACSNPHIGWIETIEVFGDDSASGRLPESSGSLPESSGRIANPPEELRSLPESSGGNGHSSGGIAQSPGVLRETPGVLRRNRESSGLQTDRQDTTIQTKQIINNQGAQEEKPDTDGEASEWHAANRSELLEEGPEVTEKRKRIYHAVRDTNWAGLFLGSKHLDELVSLTEQFPTDWVCRAIAKAGDAKEHRFGEAFISYVRKTLGTMATAGVGQQARPPAAPRKTIDQARAEGKLDGDSPAPVSPMSLFGRVANNGVRK